MNTVLGVDACKTGWVGIAWSNPQVNAYHAKTIAELAESTGPVSVIAIDIPIGFPDHGHRQADRLVRGPAPLLPKKSWSGAEARRTLLHEAGLPLTGPLGEAGTAAVDDVLDAAIAAWTARRVHDGTAKSLPSPQETFPDTIEAAIWY